jgi:hypothetical protein
LQAMPALVAGKAIDWMIHINLRPRAKF